MLENLNRYCHNCGKSIPPGAKFCPFCGTSQASIDERPPEAEPAPQRPVVPNRLQPRRQPATFKPFSPDDDDGESIAADQVGSIEELGININSLDVDLRIPMPIKESIGSLVKQGAAMGAENSQIQNRLPSMPTDQKTAMQIIMQEAQTLRK